MHGKLQKGVQVKHLAIYHTSGNSFRRTARPCPPARQVGGERIWGKSSCLLLGAHCQRNRLGPSLAGKQHGEDDKQSGRKASFLLNGGWARARYLEEQKNKGSKEGECNTNEPRSSQCVLSDPKSSFGRKNVGASIVLQTITRVSPALADPSSSSFSDLKEHLKSHSPRPSCKGDGGRLVISTQPNFQGCHFCTPWIFLTRSLSFPCHHLHHLLQWLWTCVLLRGCAAPCSTCFCLHSIARLGVQP